MTKTADLFAGTVVVEDPLASAEVVDAEVEAVEGSSETPEKG